MYYTVTDGVTPPIRIITFSQQQEKEYRSIVQGHLFEVQSQAITYTSKYVMIFKYKYQTQQGEADREAIVLEMTMIDEEEAGAIYA